MLHTPTTRHTTSKTEIALRDAGPVTLWDGIELWPVALHIRYDLAERWVDGQVQRKTRTTWTLIASREAIPTGRYRHRELDQSAFQTGFAAGAVDVTPAWIGELVTEYQPEDF